MEIIFGNNMEYFFAFSKQNSDQQDNTSPLELKGWIRDGRKRLDWSKGKDMLQALYEIKLQNVNRNIIFNNNYLQILKVLIQSPGQRWDANILATWLGQRSKGKDVETQSSRACHCSKYVNHGRRCSKQEISINQIVQCEITTKLMVLQCRNN